MTQPFFQILAHECTPLGALCLRQRRLLSGANTLVTEVSLDGEQLMSDLNCESEQALATEALAAHEGSGLDVLVGGLGLGITARQVLRSDRVARVQVLEFLPQVVSWLTGGLLPLAPELRADGRLQVCQADVYGTLLGAPAALWDLILIDVDHSPEEPLGPQSTGFYTPSGLRFVKAHLQPGGVLAVWSYAPAPTFEAALRQVFPSAWSRPVAYRDRSSGEERTDWIFLAGA